MKNTILFTAILTLVSSFSFAQIKFEKFDWEKLKQQAAVEHKIIMIDMTATWCGWCKVMDRDVFSKKSVGDYYNANFISSKLYDTHQLSEEFVKKYKVDGFPTLLFLDAKGTLIYTIDGAVTDVNAFINEGQAARAKGAHIYKNNGNNGNNNIGGGGTGGDEVEEITMNDLIERISLAVENEEDYDAQYHQLLKMSCVFDNEDALELIVYILESGNEIAISDFKAQEQRFYDQYGEYALTERLLMAGSNMTIRAFNEIYEAGKDLTIQDVDNLASAKFKKIFRDAEKAKGATYFIVANYCMEYEYIEETLDYLDKMVAYTTSLFATEEERASIYALAAFYNYEYAAHDNARLQKAIKYGLKSDSMDSTYENYMTLGNAYDALGEDEKSAKYFDLATELE